MTGAFADTSHLFLLGDSGIAFSEVSQTLHSLNTAAAMVWCWMEEGIDGPVLVAKLAGAMAVDEARASQHLDDLRAEWRALGLLAGSTPPVSDIPPAYTPPEMPPLGERADCVAACFGLLNSRILVRCDSATQMERIRPVLAHLEHSESGDLEAVPGAIIDVVEIDGRQYLYLDKVGVNIYPGISSIAPSVKGVLWRAAVNRFPHFLDIHAGVVATDDCCIILPAAPGSGKSTLTAALTHAGYHYYSDEVALLLDESLYVPPVPLGVCIKDSGIDVLSPYYPGIADLPTHHRIDGKTVRYMPPPFGTGAAARPPVPVGAIIFPKYAADAATQLTPIGKVAALHKLMDECVSMAEPLTVARVRRLVEWIADIPCFDLPMSNPDEAVSHIQVGLGGASE